MLYFEPVVETTFMMASDSDNLDFTRLEEFDEIVSKVLDEELEEFDSELCELFETSKDKELLDFEEKATPDEVFCDEDVDEILVV